VAAPGFAARSAAAALVEGVLVDHRPLSDQLATPKGPLAGLSPPERARAQALALAVLRNLWRIDAVIEPMLNRKPPERARTALRLAAAEMLADHVPPHAAVDAAVRLARTDAKARHASGMVNALARRIATEGAARLAEAPPPALPDWLAGPVAAAWGAEAAARIAAVHAAPPPLDLTPKDPDTAAQLAARLDARLLPTGSLRLGARGQVSALPGYAEGAWWVQDAAAAMPARLLGDVAGLRVLDLCAAPGGKTLQLAAAGARVTALDISAERLTRLRENLARTGLSAEIVTADALQWSPEAPFDAILIDAPCSATGTIRRHPDLPFVREGQDLAPLLALQDALLARAWDWLAPGGRLVYATCSLLPAEGEERIAAFRAARPEACQVAPADLPPAWLDPAGGVRLRPDFWAEWGGMDGFFAALLEKPAQG
jgi:16S rRNA (cytosine967-C5)-methyltransferase